MFLRRRAAAGEVGIAQALLSNPQVLIMDEPTAGLDHRSASTSGVCSTNWAGTGWCCCPPILSLTWRESPPDHPAAAGERSSGRIAPRHI